MARKESNLEKALKNPRIKSQYMKEVERLFSGPKGDPEHERDLQRLHDAYGTSRFGKQAREYIQKYGLPDDWSTLFLMIDYKDIKVVKQVLEALKEMLDEEPLTVKEGLKSKLNIITMTTSNEKLRQLAEDLLEEL